MHRQLPVIVAAYLLAARLDLFRDRRKRSREVRFEVLKSFRGQSFDSAAINRMPKPFNIALLFERAIKADNRIRRRTRLLLGRHGCREQYHDDD